MMAIHVFFVMFRGTFIAVMAWENRNLWWIFSVCSCQGFGRQFLGHELVPWPRGKTNHQTNRGVGGLLYCSGRRSFKTLRK